MEDLSFLSVPALSVRPVDQFPADPSALLKPASDAQSATDAADIDRAAHCDPQPFDLDNAERVQVAKASDLQYRLLWADVAASGGDHLRIELAQLEAQAKRLKGQAQRDFLNRERAYRRHLIAELEKLPELERTRDALEIELAAANANLSRTREAKAAHLADLAEANARAARYAAKYGHQ